MTRENLPSKIGRFEVKGLLGQGGMGAVYLAYDPDLRRDVAVKMVQKQTPQLLNRLRHEALANASLQHPNIVVIHEAPELDHVLFIVMEYLEGEDLGTALHRNSLAVVHKLTVLIQVLDALHYAHSRKIVHRDVKPSNVQILPNHSAKLLDFGIARSQLDMGLTNPGGMVGTVYYSSPEQIRGLKVDGRSDVFSTGVVAYEMFADRRPFDGEDQEAIMQSVVLVDPAPIDTSLTRRFPELEQIVEKAMAKDVSQRYQSADEMRSALETFLTQSRDAILASQLEAKQMADRALFEAKTLIDRGLYEQSTDVLQAALREDPYAQGVREQLKANTPPPPSPRPEVSTVPLPAVPVAPKPAPAPKASVPARPVPNRVDPERPTDPNQAVVTPRPGPSRRKMAAAGVAVMVLVGLAAVMAQRMAFGKPDPRPTVATTTPTTTPTAVPTTGASNPVGTTAAAPSLAGAAPVAASAAGTGAGGGDSVSGGTTVTGGPGGQGAGAVQAPGPTTADRQPRNIASGPGPVRNANVQQPAVGGNRPAAGILTPGAVYIDQANADRPMVSELAQALSAQGLTVSPALAPARFAIGFDARLEISIRDSGLAGPDSRTADFVGSVRIEDRMTGQRRQIPIKGNALEFSDLMVRQAAYARAAEQVAAAIAALGSQ